MLLPAESATRGRAVDQPPPGGKKRSGLLGSESARSLLPSCAVELRWSDAARVRDPLPESPLDKELTEYEIEPEPADEELIHGTVLRRYGDPDGPVIRAVSFRIARVPILPMGTVE